MEGSLTSVIVIPIYESKTKIIIKVDDKEIEITKNGKLIKNNIDKYLNGLKRLDEFFLSKEYTSNNTFLSEMLEIFNFKNLISIIAIMWNDEFNNMIRLYTKNYITNVNNFNAASKNSCFTHHIIKEMFKGEKSYIDSYSIVYLQKAIGEKNYRKFVNIIGEEFQQFWIFQIRLLLQNKESLKSIIEKIGSAAVSSLCVNFIKIETCEYLRDIAQQYTKRREVITYTKVVNNVIGIPITKSSFNAKLSIANLIKEIVDKEYKVQFDNFVKDNYKQLNPYNDIWIIYWFNGPSLNYKTFDFSNIECESLRKEVKYYLKFRLSGFKNPNDGFLDKVTASLNYITKSNPTIMYFADISDTDISKLFLYLENEYVSQFNSHLSVSSISKAIYSCGLIVDYLKSDKRESSIKSPIPAINYFSKWKFPNIKEFNKKTEIIPQCVSKEIAKHLNDLPCRYQLMYNIFNDTGLRAKEVAYLEENCLEESNYEGLKILKYIPYKILAARRKKNLEDYHRIVVTSELAYKIKERIDSTFELRQKCNTTYIFIDRDNNKRPSVTRTSGFVKAINKLIEKYSIKDELGNLWRFGSKQFRKTLVVNLIENGATTEEIAYWLGHLSHSTAKTYYEEVREMRLAEMNTDFFRKKFDLIISEENINTFTEEQRRLLYVDFRLEQRVVELGYCIRHFSEGVCNRRNRQFNCINCEKLCTGKKYVSYWQEVRDDQYNVVNELERIYKANKIINYQEFKEYQQEAYLLNCYNDVINKIQKN